jgi:hypothetical protein
LAIGAVAWIAGWISERILCLNASM